MKSNLNLILYLIIITLFLNSCSSIKRSGIDQPINAKDRVKKNLEEGRGLKINTSLNNTSGGNFQFASSNPLWRASLEKLDFIPLTNVDYAGGVIITDWYSDINSEEELKISLKFLSNEIRSDSLDITIYKKKCDENNKCQVITVKNETNNKIKASILKRAATLFNENSLKK